MNCNRFVYHVCAWMHHYDYNLTFKYHHFKRNELEALQT